MSTNMRNVVKLSIAFRNLCSTSNRGLSGRLLHSSSRLEARFNRPVLTSEIPQRALDDFESPDKPRSIFRQLRDCQLPEEIFGLINKESSRITGTDAVKLLQILFQMTKNIPATEVPSLITHKKELSIICETLKKHIRQLGPQDAIKCLKCLIYFQVPATTVIIQMLLQIIRTSINQLNLDEIVFLGFLLTKCQKTPLVEGLTIALPIVLETQLTTRLCFDNLDSLVKSLHYLRQIKKPSEFIPKILNVLESADSIDLTQAKHILFCLLDMQTNEQVKILVPKMMGILAEGLDELNPIELQNMIRKINGSLASSSTKSNVGFFYHEGFADACGATVVSRNLGYQIAAVVTAFYSNVGHMNIALLDYMAAKCFEDKNILANADTAQIVSMWHLLSQADYKPVLWDSIKEFLMSEKLLELNATQLTKIGLCMASLDVYWPKLLEKTFTEFEMKNFKSHGLKKKILLLHEAVKTWFPEYKGPWLMEDILKQCSEMPVLEKLQNPLQKTIECALGGPQYVLTGLRTTFGYYVDHVVIMRKGGFPIAINNPGDSVIEKLQDLKALQDGQVLVFMYIPNYGQARNTDRLTGHWSFLIKQIEAGTKHTVIPIHSKSWQKLSEEERIRYMSQAIRLKCDELSAIVN